MDIYNKTFFKKAEFFKLEIGETDIIMIVWDDDFNTVDFYKRIETKEIID